MRWRGRRRVCVEDGEDFRVGLERDEDGFGGSDTAAVPSQLAMPCKEIF